MWLHFALIFLAGTALVDSVAWKPNHVYHYIVQSRAIAGVKVSEQVTGVLMRGQLKVYVTSPDVLVVKFFGAQSASIHTSMPDGWNVQISDSEVKYVGMPMMKDPVKVTLRNGKIDKVFATPRESGHAVNFIKGILSQLQFEIDKITHKQFNRPFGGYQMFTTKEQTVSGYCNTKYDVMPLFLDDIRKANLPHLDKSKEDGYLRISKYRNYKDCLQKPIYQFVMTNKVGKNVNEEYMTRSSWTNMIISHKNEYYTIRSSVTESIIQVRPKLNDMETSKVFNMMNMTLVKIEGATKEIAVPPNVVSTGNLTYVFNMREGNFIQSYYSDFEFGESAESDPRRTIGKTRDKHSERFETSEQDSSESNSREHSRHKRELDEAMVPGMDNTWDYTSPDLIKQIDLLIYDITTEITTPDEIVKQETLEKFTILTKILRYMNDTSIAALENKLQIAHKTTKQDQNKIIAWNVFRDAIAQSGTLAAFKIIRTWIVEEKLTNLEMSSIIGQLPRVVRQPTPKYIQQFYELIKSPHVKNRAVVNTTAPYAFSEMVRYALVWDQRYTYPTLPLGDTIHQKGKNKMIMTYISYFADELEKAYRAKHNSGILAYTLALGNIGHPAIIKVFEPYLEGEYNITTFQRTIMVNSMRNVLSENHEIVRPIIYKIYQNEKEHYQVRVMAVNLLLKSNPPGYILRRMAERISDEPDLQVRNAVITGIESLTKLKERKYERIVSDAIAANGIIKKYNKKSNFKYSTTIIRNIVNEQKDYAASYCAFTIASKISVIPNIMDIKFKSNSSYFSPPAFKSQYGITDINIILDVIKSMFKQITNNEGQSKVDELVEKLNLVHNAKEPLEGNFVLSDEYRVFVVTFDDQTVQNILREIMLMNELTKYNYFKDYLATKLFNREFTISYPSEIGIPVTYHSKAPMLISVKNKIHAKKESFHMEMDEEIDVVISRKTISRIVFTTPFRKEQYFAGVDVDWQMRIPVMLGVQLNLKLNTIRVEDRSIPGTNQAKLWQYSVFPYTGYTCCLDFKTVRANKNTQPIIIGKITRTTDLLFGKKIITQETDNFQDHTIRQFDKSFTDVSKYIMNVFFSNPLYYRKQEISRNNRPTESNSKVISILYASTTFKFEQEMIENMEALGKLLSKSERTLKDFRNVDIFSVHLQMPDDNIDYKCYGGIMHLKDMITSEAQATCELLNSDLSKEMIICADAEVAQTLSSCSTIDVSSEKKRQFRASVRYGKSCESGKEISVEGIQKQSEDVRKEIINSKIYEQSTKEMAAGNLGLVNTEKLCKFIDFMDESAFSFKMDPEDAKTVHYFAIKELIKKVIPNANVKFIKPQTSNLDFWNVVNFKIGRQFHSNRINVTLNSGPLVMQMPMDISAMPFENFISYPVDSLMGINNNKKFCTLGQTKLKTFDNKVYSVNVEKCPRVLMINPTSLKYNLDLDLVTSKLSAVPDHNNIAISYKDIENGKREIMIMYQNKVFNIRTFSSDNRLVVNGKTVEFDQNSAVIEINPYITVMRLSPAIYEITVKPSEVVIWYDSERVQIQASDEYNGRVRGLCGTKDDHEETNFLTPQGCVVKKPELAIASYTFDTDKYPYDEDTKRLRKEALEKCTVIQ